MIIRLDDLAEAIIAEVTDQIARMRTRGHASRVRAFMAGESPACARTAVTWGSLAKQCGAEFTVHILPATASMQDIDARLDAISTDPDITGVCFLPPVPADRDLLRLARRLPLCKDILGIHPENLGMALGGPDELFPPLAQAVMATLTTAHVDVFGKSVLMTGDPYTLALPLTAALVHRHARVTIAQPDDPHLGELVLAHDILILEGVGTGAVKTVKEAAVALDLSPRGTDDLQALAGGAFGAAVLDQASAVMTPGTIERLRDAFVMQNLMECSRMQEGTAPAAAPTWKGNRRK